MSDGLESLKKLRVGGGRRPNGGICKAQSYERILNCLGFVSNEQRQRFLDSPCLKACNYGPGEQDAANQYLVDLGVKDEDGQASKWIRKTRKDI
jgi:hypothetical protein